MKSFYEQEKIKFMMLGATSFSYIVSGILYHRTKDNFYRFHGTLLSCYSGFLSYYLYQDYKRWKKMNNKT